MVLCLPVSAHTLSSRDDLQLLLWRCEVFQSVFSLLLSSTSPAGCPWCRRSPGPPHSASWFTTSSSSIVRRHQWNRALKYPEREGSLCHSAQHSFPDGVSSFWCLSCAPSLLSRAVAHRDVRGGSVRPSGCESLAAQIGCGLYPSCSGRSHGVSLRKHVPRPALRVNGVLCGWEGVKFRT